MKVSKSYTLSEFLVWTRRKVYVVLALAILPVAVYQLLGQKWIALPWSLAVLLGTATSFIVGFKNAQTYNRTVEAHQVWSAIASASRYWGTVSRDFPANPRSTLREDQHDLHLVLRRPAAVLRHKRVRSTERRRFGIPCRPDVVARDSLQCTGVLDVRVPRPGRREHGEPFRSNGERRSDLQISRLVEIELGEMLGETDLPPALPVRHDIVL
jgi:predicted membrane chloride channel (bestrophin family)